MNNKYTHGNWEIVKFGGVGGDGFHVCSEVTNEGCTPILSVSSYADARLIASAPSLLTALIGCVESLKTMDKNPFDEFNHSMALAAINKATGHE